MYGTPATSTIATDPKHLLQNFTYLAVIKPCFSTGRVFQWFVTSFTGGAAPLICKLKQTSVFTLED